MVAIQILSDLHLEAPRAVRDLRGHAEGAVSGPAGNIDNAARDREEYIGFLIKQLAGAARERFRDCVETRRREGEKDLRAFVVLAHGRSDITTSSGDEDEEGVRRERSRSPSSRTTARRRTAAPQTRCTGWSVVSVRLRHGAATEGPAGFGGGVSGGGGDATKLEVKV
ncbi:hypothetical protein DL767_005857 [Monosporascus sp. MG133]|nr:hypothetical protein DL767_005857 [Monosporascus sp. MG133]